MQDVLTGSVIRTESLTADRAFFISLQEASGEVNRVRVLEGAFEFAPRRGEYIQLIGSYQKNSAVGDMFVGSSGTTIVPDTPKGLSNLFALYPLFAFLDRPQRQALESASFSRLIASLNDGDVHNLCKGGVSPEVVLGLQEAWRTYSDEVRLMGVTRGLHISPGTLHTLVRSLPSAAESFEADPFLISAMVRWDDLDKLAQARGFAKDDPRRLRGAVTAAYFTDGIRQRWVFNKPELLVQLSKLLESSELGEEAFRLGVLGQLLTVRGDGGVQDKAGALLTAAAQQRFQECAGVRHLRQGKRSRLNAARAVAHRQPDAVHIFPNSLLLDAVGATSSTTFSDLVAESMDRAPHEWESVVLHGFDLLDPCGINRVLFQLGKPELILVSTDNSSPMPWWPVIAEAPDGRTSLDEYEEWSGPALGVISTPDDLIGEALRSYRENSVSSPALIVCADKFLSSSLNATLHEETIDYRRNQELECPLVDIESKQAITLDEPVFWTKNFLRQGAVAGTYGRVSAIAPRILEDDVRDVGALTVEVADRHQLQVPWTAKSLLRLGYSIDADDCAGHNFDRVIAVVRESCEAERVIQAARNVCRRNVIVICSCRDESHVTQICKELNEAGGTNLGKEVGRSTSVPSRR